jgi:alcohol dehydrogenase, propanol-preferring
VLASGEGTAKRIMEACGGPVGVVIDLVNGTQTSRFAFDALRKGGKLIQVGLFGGEMNIPLPLMPIRALTVQGSYVGNVKELKALLEIAKKGQIPPIPIATEPLQNADSVLNRLRDGKVVGRVVLTAA